MVQVAVHVYATPVQVEALTQRLACLVAVGTSPVVTALKCTPASAAVTAELVRPTLPPFDGAPGRAGYTLEVLLGTCSRAQLEAVIDRLCAELTENPTENPTEERRGHTSARFPWLVRIQW